MSTLGQTIFEFRTRKNLSQAAVARASGLNHSLISRYENGTRVALKATILQIATGLGLDEAETDQLLVAGGYWPEQVERLIIPEPILANIAIKLNAMAEAEDGRVCQIRAALQTVYDAMPS